MRAKSRQTYSTRIWKIIHPLPIDPPTPSLKSMLGGHKDHRNPFSTLLAAVMSPPQQQYSHHGPALSYSQATHGSSSLALSSNRQPALLGYKGLSLILYFVSTSVRLTDILNGEYCHLCKKSHQTSHNHPQKSKC